MDSIKILRSSIDSMMKLDKENDILMAFFLKKKMLTSVTVLKMVSELFVSLLKTAPLSFHHQS